MQLVCVDRRYQRMNCFNIRELQGVLKRKFFTDLVNTNDHRDFLNQSIIGLRFKSNNQLSITPDMESFFNLGTTTNTKAKTNIFTNSYFVSNLNGSSYALNFDINYIFSGLSSILLNFVSLVSSINVNSLFTLTSLPSSIKQTLLANIKFTSSDSYVNPVVSNLSPQTSTNLDVSYSTTNINSNNELDSLNNTLSETSNNVRFTRFYNPLISYDYKCGHYLGI